MDDRAFAAQLALWMEAHLTDPGDGRELEKVSGYSGNRLRDKFFRATGETPAGYLRKRRLTEAARALLSGQSLVDVAARFGYSSQENFTTAFKSWFSLTPGELRTTDRNYRFYLSRIKEPFATMEIAKLTQSPLCTTFIGCMQGAAAYWDLDWTAPELFGYTGFGFMLNVHPELCPSAPYVWTKDAVYLALRDLGIRRTESFEIKKGVPAADIAAADAKLRAWLDAGKLAMLEFLECQLTAGYDAAGFRFLQPWNSASTELKTLSFGSWTETLDTEGWAYFTLLEADPLRADKPRLLRSAVATALRMRSRPAEFTFGPYRAGDAGWETWLAANEAGHGSSHGNWWNGMVWAECRNQAGEFFAAVPTESDAAAALCSDLAAVYRSCGSALAKAADKAIPTADRRAALEAGRAADAKAENLLRELGGVL
jgi:AraC-like DNA-binding protein